MRNFKYVISLATAASIAFPTSLFAAAPTTGESLKASMKELGIVSNKDRPTLQTVYLRARPDLPKEVRKWMDFTIAQFGDRKIPAMETQIIKGSHGQEILKLSLKNKADGKVVVEIDPSSEKAPVKINGKGMTIAEWTTQKTFTEFFGTDTADLEVTKARSILPSYNLYSQMRPADRAMYFIKLRQVLNAAQKVKEPNGAGKTADATTANRFEVLLKLLAGLDAEAANTGIGLATKIQVAACNDLANQKLFKSGLNQCYKNSEKRAHMFAQVTPEQYRSAIATAKKSIIEEAALLEGCREATGITCSRTTARSWAKGSTAVKAAFDSRYNALTAEANKALTTMDQAQARIIAQEVNKKAKTAKDEKIKAACHEFTNISANCNTVEKSERWLNTNAKGRSILAKHLGETAPVTPVAGTGLATAPASRATATATPVANAKVVDHRTTHGGNVNKPNSPTSGGGSTESDIDSATTSTEANGTTEVTSTTPPSNSCLMAGYIGALGANGCAKSQMSENIPFNDKNMLASFDADCSGGKVACNPLMYGFSGNGKAICAPRAESNKMCEAAAPISKDKAGSDVAKILESLLKKKNKSVDEFIKDGKISEDKFRELKDLVLGDMQTYISSAISMCGDSQDQSCRDLAQRNENLATGLNALQSQLSGNQVTATEPANNCTTADGTTPPQGCNDQSALGDVYANDGQGHDGPTPYQQGPSDVQPPKQSFMSKMWGGFKKVLPWLAIGAVGIFAYFKFFKKDKKKDSTPTGPNQYQYDNGIPQPVDVESTI